MHKENFELNKAVDFSTTQFLNQSTKQIAVAQVGKKFKLEEKGQNYIASTGKGEQKQNTPNKKKN